MKKGLLVALCTVGLVIWGITAASAGTITWTMVETATMAKVAEGPDGLLGTGDDVSNGTNCNYSDASACAVTGNPTTGAYSLANLQFVQSSSCVIASGGNSPGDTCTQNSDCGSPLGICVDCNSGTGGAATGYFARNPSGGSRGLGTLTANACDNGFTWSNIAIGTSEVITASGGSCMTLTPGSGTGNSGCGVGPLSANMSLDLYTSTLPNCGFKAGTMPGIALAGSVIDAGAGPGAPVCGYTVAQLGAIIADAGLGAGSYLSVLCGNGTLPSNLQSACLPGASWASVMVTKTSTSVGNACGEACSSGGCMAGTAEGVE